MVECQKVAVVALMAAPLLVYAQAQPSAEEVGRAVLRHYDQVKDFTADFTHTYQGGVLKKTVTERGTVQIKKPGKMRWEYTSPERKTFDFTNYRENTGLSDKIFAFTIPRGVDVIRSGGSH